MNCSHSMTAADWIIERTRIEEAASEGPWRLDSRYGYKIVTPCGAWGVQQTVGHIDPPDASRPNQLRGVIESCNASNAEFIIDARTALPKALDALEAVLSIWPDADPCDCCTHADCEVVRTITEALT